MGSNTPSHIRCPMKDAGKAGLFDLGHFAKRAKVSNASRPGSRVFDWYLKCNTRTRFYVSKMQNAEYRLKKDKSTMQK